jgi:hypothetical protein
VNKLQIKKEEFLSLLEKIENIDKLSTEVSKYRKIYSSCMKTAVQLNEQILNLKMQIDKYI